MLDFRLEAATYHNVGKLQDRIRQQDAGRARPTTEETESAPPEPSGWWREIRAVLTGLLRGQVL